MADQDAPSVPSPSPEHRRVAAGQFERANEVITTGNFDYGIQLLLNCCKLDPANLIYRQALRRTEKTKFGNNLRGSRLAVLTTTAARARVKAAKRAKDYLKVLEQGEQILTRNPWDTGVQLDMAAAAAALGLLDVAVWTLEEARQKDPLDCTVNRGLALLYEKRGNFTQAMKLWELVQAIRPDDAEAVRKAKDLAAHDTIARVRANPLPRAEADVDDSCDDEAAEATADMGAEAAAPAEPAVPRPPLDRVGAEAAPVWARIKADPTSANAYLHLAGLYRKVGQTEQAREVLRQGLAPTGNNFDIMSELADVEIDPFRRNLALTEEKLRSESQEEELRRIRIRLLKEINTRELDLFRQKADRYPADKGYRFEMGLRLLRAQQYDEAILALQAVGAEPRYQWRAYLYLGYCFKARNNGRVAVRNFQEALRSLPSGEEEARKELLYQLAQGHADAGEFAQALEYGHQLADFDFDYRDIVELTDRWQEQAETGAGPPLASGGPAVPPAEEPY
jgi:tetratricopeptide (TPR) repeat protein